MNDFNSYDEYRQWSEEHERDNAANAWEAQRESEQAFGKAVDASRHGEIINE